MKQLEASNILCDKIITMVLKSNFYISVVRHLMLYGLQCWTIDMRVEHSMRVLELSMFRWISEVRSHERRQIKERICKRQYKVVDNMR